MKKISLLILFYALWSGPALAQEGFSPTLPFGTKGMERTQAPVNNPYPVQDYRSPYRNGSYYNYYYGPNGVYGNSYGQNGYAQPGSAQYKSSNYYDGLPANPSGNSIPGYNQPTPQNAPPGY